jgi:hypothetical protein
MQTERVHIAAQGFEHERIVKPAIKDRPHRVVLLEHADGERAEWFKDVRQELEEAGITVEPESCNIFDMYSVIERVSRIAKRYEDADIYVNISTGSKPSAIGGMIACMANDLTPYYVKPEGYGDPDEGEIKPMSYGVEYTKQLSAYPMETPTRQEIWVMEFISQNRSVSKQAVIDFGRGDRDIGSGYEPDGRLPFMSEEYKDKATANHNRVSNHIIDPLTEKGWIKTEERGTHLYLELTDEGEDTLRGFRHMIE